MNLEYMPCEMTQTQKDKYTIILTRTLKFIETEKGQFSVWDVEKVLDMISSDGYTEMQIKFNVSELYIKIQ